jgi:hypothetical protein
VPRRTLLAVSTALTLLIFTTGCGGSGDGTEYVADTGDADASAAAFASPAANQPPVTAKEVTGHWVSSDFGDAYVQVEGAEVRVVYTHDGGRMTGSLRGLTFVGWWSETPSRRPSDDAGEVELTFVRSGGKLTAQGWWRPGTDSEFEAEWTMEKADVAIPAAVRADFSDRSKFIRHP